ncbi:MAG TPA: hypothetical protein VIV60_36245 [Polyangiaceae bacterium]
MTRHPIPVRTFAVSVALLLISISGPSAASEDLERARAVFRDALVLEVAGDWAAALTKFQEVAKARLTPQVRYHLARCKEHLGRQTEALGDYRVAEVEARSSGLEETGEIERARRDLEARIPQLFLRVDGSMSMNTIELDGIALGPSALNQPMVVNPGRHRISIRNASGQASESFIDTEPGKQIELDLRDTVKDVTPTKPIATPIVLEAPSGRHFPTWAYFSTAIGAAAVVSSAILFVVREQAIRDLDGACKPVCEDSERSTLRRGQAASIAAPIALGVGVATLGLATWGFLIGGADNGSNRGRRTSTAVSGVVGSGILGVQIASKF